MKKRTISLVAIMASLALTSPVFATGNYQKTTNMNHNQELKVGQTSLSADHLLGMTIESKDGKDIGEIQDIKIDPSNGRIDYVTVQVGGVLGLGGKDGVAVPIEAFRFANDKALLTVDESKLKNAPKRANLSDENFRRDLQSHYGISPSWSDNRSNPASDMNTMDKSQQMNMDSTRDSSDMQKSQ